MLLYDLRSSRPVLTKDHMYGNPMVDVKWHTGPGGERRVISTDTRIVKIWCGGSVDKTLHEAAVFGWAGRSHTPLPLCRRDANNGTAFTSIEPEADINDVCIWPGDGAWTGAANSHCVRVAHV